MPRKIMFLGASAMQMPPILYARKQGYEVVTVDYLPDNPGHRYADCYINLSITDRDAVLEAARRADIDGIVAYASDIAAPTAAYVAERMDLPGNPYESVLILTNKDRFRAFLAGNGFSSPRARGFDDIREAREFAGGLTLPVFVKPVDSSGSKGVTRVDSLNGFDAAGELAMRCSISGRIIVEEDIFRKGYQVAGDGFASGGELVFRCWANEHFEKLCNALVPIGESFPSVMTPQQAKLAHLETQRMLSLLDMRFGAFNFDFVFDADGGLHFLELGPRNGGNLIPEVIRYATGVDLIAYTVEMALGHDVDPLSVIPVDGYWSSYILHANVSGRFRGFSYGDAMKRCVVEENVTVTPGQHVSPFTGANYGLGSMILRFDDQQQMLDMMDNIEEYMDVLIDE